MTVINMMDHLAKGAPGRHQFATAKEAREFVTAGNALITLESRKTGNWFTYRVKQVRLNRYFVSVLSGQDNESSYSYIGLLDKDWRSGDVDFRQTGKVRFDENAPSVRGFRYFWEHVVRDLMPGDMIARHNGKCGRCGRTLTVPESIERGIGPECATKIG